MKTAPPVPRPLWRSKIVATNGSIGAGSSKLIGTFKSQDNHLYTFGKDEDGNYIVSVKEDGGDTFEYLYFLIDNRLVVNGVPYTLVYTDEQITGFENSNQTCTKQ